MFETFNLFKADSSKLFVIHALYSNKTSEEKFLIWKIAVLFKKEARFVGCEPRKFSSWVTPSKA